MPAAVDYIEAGEAERAPGEDTTKLYGWFPIDDGAAVLYANGRTARDADNGTVEIVRGEAAAVHRGVQII